MISNSNLNDNNKSVMIIGGGMAGMATALTLNDHGIIVHLIEQSNHLGGHASFWACMATDTCQNCSACISHEMADRISLAANINTYLNTKVCKIDTNKNKYIASLKGKKDHTIEADKIILATGFTPIKPNGLMGDVYHRNKHIITTADLNQILKTDTLIEYFPKTTSPKIGFIQCVGSRNREKGKDYCSQVCCKLSLRHINKLLYLYPDAKITLFYIDLQIIGKETRSKFNSLSGKVDLIQGVPFEIFDNKIEGKLSVIREDSENGNRMADHFDMIVLSVGISACSGTTGLTDLLDLPLDQWGFVNDHAVLAEKGIYAAGCATGPVDILGAKQQGINCAQKIIKSFRQTKSRPPPCLVAVIGDGDQAQRAAIAASKQGYEVWMFCLGRGIYIQSSDIHLVTDANLISIKGAVGNFTILYQTFEGVNQENFVAIIVAESANTLPVVKKTTLPPDGVYSLKQFSNKVDHSLEAVPQTLVFWLDSSGPQFKASSRTALLMAIKLAKTKRRIFFIMNHMLVHKLEGQQTYDRARKLGIKFFRTDSIEDVSLSEKNKKIVFDLKEKTLKNILLSFESDWLILPENRMPSNKNPMIAMLLKERLDTEGYLQSANVRHRLTHSPRKGIFFTGSCHDETDEQDQTLEIQMILSSIGTITDNKTAASSFGIEINTQKCRNCLTCFRICPHGAIVLNDDARPCIVPGACFSCGLCLSSCPALAIESGNFSDASYVNPVSKGRIIVFACERSGALAAENIERIPGINIQKVPCVCRIGENIVLKTLEKGAKKILLAGCHPGNCQSINGSRTAQVRAKILNRFEGINDSTVIWQPFAANESVKFKQFLTQNFLQK
ncbi:MAG: FAD-dependent oxidoreductase [Proteobacteria bacterium]|nr:FAD-dependent oxidoreductase [Pseudomonadota bacterium]MBU1582440.1 FAD-dependent oxidoreductase [Pseudomonadota bacterium]MBU2453762.1 FAD-dependent oxidoreductase [Pseudomonadota bacterium]MBU2627455.1 FAD-dependent oxidoreductase [Pseudomonadota bacterium]